MNAPVDNSKPTSGKVVVEGKPLESNKPTAPVEDPNVGTGSQVAKATQSQPQTVAGDGSIRATTIAHTAEGKVVAQPPVVTTPTSGPKPPSAKFDSDKVSAKLKAVVDFYYTYSGKNGYNPHFFLHKEVSPLQVRVQEGERSEELYNAVMALKTEEGLAKIK